jgi:hypothetical protein
MVTFHRIALVIADDEVALAATSSITGAPTTISSVQFGFWRRACTRRDTNAEA